MKVLAINTGPSKDGEVMNLLLAPYLGGMRGAGAEIELCYAADLTLFPCCGNLNCTVRTPGICMPHDDMRGLRRKIGDADVLVMASPLYYGDAGAPATARLAKALAGRRVPGGYLPGDEPYGHAVHTVREPVSLRKVVVVSAWGFWEIDGFFPVLTHLKAFCQNTFPELAGCITGPLNVRLREVPGGGAPVRKVREAARKAGRQLVIDDEPRPPRDGGLRDRPSPAPEWNRRDWEGIVLYQF